MLKKELKIKNVESKVEDEKNVKNIDDDLLIVYDCENDCLMTKYSIIWVDDSHASFHATPTWSFFTTYKVFDLSVVRMRNKDTV